jgi:diacylglycerol kinase family enzyme
MKATLFVNPRSGDGQGEDALDAARELGVDVHVLEEGDDLVELAQKADAEVLGMAGGDGSLGAVAGVCLERGLPFVCVPFGTRNHFARDLGLDRDDPVAAVAAFAPDAEERRVDVGRVGERVFLNNVSLGLYAGLVHDREQRRKRDETFARLKALRLLATERDAVALRVDGAPFEAHLLLIANNSYTPPPSVFSLGGRERLDEGTLYLYVGAGMLPRHWDIRAAERFEIDCPAGKVHAAVDGEPEEFETPVALTVEPRALRVLLPRAPE